MPSISKSKLILQNSKKNLIFLEKYFIRSSRLLFSRIQRKFFREGNRYENLNHNSFTKIKKIFILVIQFVIFSFKEEKCVNDSVCDKRSVYNKITLYYYLLYKYKKNKKEQFFKFCK